MLKVLQIKLQVWDKRIFDPLNYGMRKLDTISNFSRSQAILDQLGQVTEIFVCIHNPSEREREREREREWYFDISRFFAVNQLLRKLFSKTGIVLVSNKWFWQVYCCYVKGLKVVCEVVWNHSNITKNFITQTHDYFVFLSF